MSRERREQLAADAQKIVFSQYKEALNKVRGALFEDLKLFRSTQNTTRKLPQTPKPMMNGD